MKNVAQNLMDKIVSVTGYRSSQNHNTENEILLSSIKQAQEEWYMAQQYFQNVTDPDLVDYAIYQIEATKLRYFYLLKQARENGLKSEELPNTSM